ncbi:MAG TPA: hypothetical protein VFV99_21435 [Kofleriaceae bacterium]|nr:hypothetical protein [Kofleriaceae bacterium]
MTRPRLAIGCLFALCIWAACPHSDDHPDACPAPNPPGQEKPPNDAGLCECNYTPVDYCACGGDAGVTDCGATCTCGICMRTCVPIER